MYGLGYVKDEDDDRDQSWRALASSRMELPPSWRRKKIGPPIDQGAEPKCVAFSTASLKFNQEYRQHRRYYDFDPHWLYALCKQNDGIPDQDGTFIRTALKICQDQGYLAKAAPRKLKQDTYFKVTSYVRLRTIHQMKEALYKVGPVVFGIQVDRSIYAPDAKGIIAEPTGRPEGGHAQCAIGWNDNLKCQDSIGAFLVKNSWGASYGINGCYWLPYSHFDKYDDFDAWRTLDAEDKAHLLAI